MKNAAKYVLGFAMVIVALLWMLDILNLVNVTFLFKGWWTLFIIVPCSVALFTERDKAGPLALVRSISRIPQEYGIGGIHLNRRNSTPPEGYCGRLSRSLHSIDELTEADGNDYCTLSPIYDSISKAGYRSNFSADALRQALTDRRIKVPVIALGGVTPEKLGELQQLGFAGAAFLGYLFADVDIDVLKQRILTIKQHL